MELTVRSLGDVQGWAGIGVKLPVFDPCRVAARTREEPVWLHFGTGNIFRGFIANLQQALLDEGLADRGITAVVSADSGTLEPLYRAHDNLTLLCAIQPNGEMKKSVIASIGEVVASDDRARLREVFEAASLEMVSYTITEKGYATHGADGVLPAVRADMEAGPEWAATTIGQTCAGLYWRYRAGKRPLAVVSMDNMSANGDKLRAAVLLVGRAWVDAGMCDAGFVEYVEDRRSVSFPLSMIDKITPGPAASVREHLEGLGINGMAPFVTARNTKIAPYVNAEAPEYLVVEDDFPNGRPKLEAAGAYLTDRGRVSDAEKMKVTTCLNPLHTALAIFGCLLGYTLIADEMKDADLRALAERVGQEGMKVVCDPGIIAPEQFLRQVLEERFPNPFMPDTPQRIASDTSQKIPIRFGETLKRYQARKDLDVQELRAIPLALAGWIRYLLGVDDEMKVFQVSPDPLMGSLQAALVGVRVGEPCSLEGQIEPLLCDARLFGLDLVALGISERVEGYLRDMLGGKGSVRDTMRRELGL